MPKHNILDNDHANNSNNINSENEYNAYAWIKKILPKILYIIYRQYQPFTSQCRKTNFKNLAAFTVCLTILRHCEVTG